MLRWSSLETVRSRSFYPFRRLREGQGYSHKAVDWNHDSSSRQQGQGMAAYFQQVNAPSLTVWCCRWPKRSESTSWVWDHSNLGPSERWKLHPHSRSSQYLHVVDLAGPRNPLQQHLGLKHQQHLKLHKRLLYPSAEDSVDPRLLNNAVLPCSVSANYVGSRLMVAKLLCWSWVRPLFSCTIVTYCRMHTNIRVLYGIVHSITTLHSRIQEKNTL